MKHLVLSLLLGTLATASIAGLVDKAPGYQVHEYIKTKNAEKCLRVAFQGDGDTDEDIRRDAWTIFGVMITADYGHDIVVIKRKYAKPYDRRTLKERDWSLEAASFIEAHYPRSCYHLYGYSGGGWVARLLATTLTNTKLLVGLAPGYSSVGDPKYNNDRVVDFVSHSKQYPLPSEVTEVIIADRRDKKVRWETLVNYVDNAKNPVTLLQVLSYSDDPDHHFVVETSQLFWRQFPNILEGQTEPVLKCDSLKGATSQNCEVIS